MSTCDNDADQIFSGDKVKVLSVDPQYLTSLPEDERKLVSSMVGEVLTVDEVEDERFIYVSKSWDIEGIHCYHSLCLLKSEVEKILGNRRNSKGLSKGQSS